MRRVMALAACAALALPAAAQDTRPEDGTPFVTVTPPAGEAPSSGLPQPSVPMVVLDAVQRLPPSGALEAPLRSAVCAFAPIARHLEPLASNVPWAQLRAVVLFGDLPGLTPGQRAAVLRPTRELLARAATRDRIAEGGIALFDHDMQPLPANAPRPAFLAILIPPPEAPPEDCVAQPPPSALPAAGRSLYPPPAGTAPPGGAAGPPVAIGPPQPRPGPPPPYRTQRPPPAPPGYHPRSQPPPGHYPWPN
ncbi:hypothetical protein KPL78_14225 [Roseomonas sp. HJA6]|uniref:DUF3300 domain-containing protein n=1 Tax=Roseomonas alba TaxID=2846776 RepID=A0ABS7A9P1_9PROT|nr:hypothetical protein [Neoroseomonas alba]MBW6399018.1 hypothetical protein [Neoroseomonas alba]